MTTVEHSYEVQAQPTNSDLWILSGRFNTLADAEAQAVESANQDRPMFRAFRIVHTRSYVRVLPTEYLVVHHG